MSIPLSEQLVTTVARRLRDGNLHYSARQLYYGVCAELEAPQVSRGDAQAALGVLLMVGGVVCGIFVSIFCGLAVPFGLLVTAMGLQRRRVDRNRPTTRPLALGYDEFLAGLERLPVPAGLVGASAKDAATAAETGGCLVVCDRTETSSVLRANLDRSDISVVDEASAVGRLAAARRVFTLHDADPSGCALPLRLHAAGAVELIDIGLRPAHISGRHLQVIEGAPLVVAADVAALLTPDEIVWLAAGLRAELAILTPREIVDAVLAATADDVEALHPAGFPDGMAVSSVVPVQRAVQSSS